MDLEIFSSLLIVKLILHQTPLWVTVRNAVFWRLQNRRNTSQHAGAWLGVPTCHSVIRSRFAWTQSNHSSKWKAWRTLHGVGSLLSTQAGRGKPRTYIRDVPNLCLCLVQKKGLRKLKTMCTGRQEIGGEGSRGKEKAWKRLACAPLCWLWDSLHC